MNATLPRLRVIAALFLAPMLLGGCYGLRGAGRQHQSSSVVQFLYPDQSQPFVQPSIPTLRLPLRVGIAFVPPAASQYGYFGSDMSFPEAKKAELLRRVSDEFRSLPFVEGIEIVPVTYLRPGGSFENLEQLRSMLGVDVVALVAYDQAQITNDTAWTLAYWTIVGAYVVPAQKNDTYTLMEAVVYDIHSRKLLFRAPGTSTVKGHSTMIRTAEELRGDSVRSFDEAAKDLTANLKVELEAFKTRIKEAPEEVHIEHKPGYSGAGALDGVFIIVSAVLLGGPLVLSRLAKPARVQPRPASIPPRSAGSAAPAVRGAARCLRTSGRSPILERRSLNREDYRQC
jgi:rhombotail lipoprotein